MSEKHYDAIDGLRAFAAIGIIMMHVGANSKYNIHGILYTKAIPEFTNFVFLFMVVSGFAMCCGYYDKIINNSISLTTFYAKRYTKIWPYFALLVIIDFVMNPSIPTLIETFADLTLCFGLLPNINISVIGVGWFLGLVFLFYIIFPFFCFLLKSKKRAWFAFLIAIIYNITCNIYFLNSDHVIEGFNFRTNFLFSFMFFMAGGLIYLYKNEVYKTVEKYKWLILILSIGTSIIYFMISEFFYSNVITYIWILVIFSLWLIYAIGTDGKILHNNATVFLSSISMEIYLSHMIIFRVVEKLHLNYLFGESIASYAFTVITVVLGSTVFALCAKWFLKNIKRVCYKIVAISRK